jgi:hypothetical protein
VFEIVVEDLSKLRSGKHMYCGYTKSTLLVKVGLMAICADNPRASYICSIIGLTGNQSCRFCSVDRSKDPLRLGMPRTREQTVEYQRIATRGKPCEGVTSVFSPLLLDVLSFDPHIGTPIDLLHTILLGM